jgi:hypothetical protein
MTAGLCVCIYDFERDEFAVKKEEVRLVVGGKSKTLYFFLPFSLPLEVSVLSQYASIVVSK